MFGRWDKIFHGRMNKSVLFLAVERDNCRAARSIALAVDPDGLLGASNNSGREIEKKIERQSLPSK